MDLRRLVDQPEGRRPRKRSRSDAVTNGNAKKVHVENNPELFRSVYKRPGRLPPRWLLDLCTGALADAASDHGHLFMSCEQLPNRLTLPKTASGDGDNGSVPTRTSHDLFLQESQTLMNETGEVVSCMCKHCKYHFEFVFKGTQSFRCGNGLTENPLCHLVLARSEELQPHEEDNKWHPCTHTAEWMCSDSRCPVQISVSITQPRMKAEHVAWIVDEARIRNQRQQALAQDPVRFANLNGDLEIKPLVTLNAYLRDCLQHSASSEPKKVASRNKIFVVQFGQLSLPIFQHLGFEVSAIDGEEYLILPRPPDAAGNTPIGSMRAYYEDLKHEILTLIDETGREQVKESHHPAKARLERALSCYNSRYTARPRLQDNPADLHTLGVTANSNEDLLKFAFLCQMQTNPAKRGEYCTALQGLATSRSDDMQMFAALQMSMEAATREPITDPLAQAYVHFGMPDDTQDDSTIITRYELLCGEDPGRKKQHRQMLFRIGQARESQAIQNVARDMSDFKEACQFLDVDADEVGIKASADVLLGFIETQVRDDGKDPALVATALDTIANRIDNPEMKRKARFYRHLGDQGQFIYSPVDASAVASTNNDSNSVNPNLPIGLDNLRNTCYLNSILQYFFTVKAVRDIVLNFDPDKVPLTEATRGDGEVYLGREFVLELKRLFSELNGTPARFIKPQQRLANAAWISVDKVQKDNKQAAQATDSQPATTPNDNQHAARPVPPIPTDKTAAKPTVTVDSVPENSETASISSSQTLTNQPDAPSDLLFSDDMDVDSAPNGALGEVSEAHEASDITEDTGNGVEKPSLEALIEALKGALAQTEIQGTEQMDVEEVMGRCINHLRAAINPASVTNSSGAGVHSDEIMENLYITFANSRKEKDAPAYNRNTSQERWVTANPAISGSLSLYGALDGYFEREFIGNKLVSFTSIVTAPPIFHICIQRSQVGGGKNTNPVVIPEVLYLDRYMESDEGSPLYKARKRSWDIKSQLRDLDVSLSAYGPKEGADGVPTNLVERFMANRNFPTSVSIDEEDLEVVDPRLRYILDQHGKPLKSDIADGTPPELTDGSDDDEANDGSGAYAAASKGLEQVVSTTQQSSLREELDGLFASMKTYKYCLHSVICHAGQTAKSGHYWVWIYDFEQNIWRKYNDRTVTENADTQAVLEDLSTKGEPYYLMYVRDEDKNDLVSVPRPNQNVGVDTDVNMEDTTVPISDSFELSS